jgi:hypothetical protein
MPDVWELAHGLDPYRNDAAEDPDGDGLTNLVEYLNGTDPHVNNSTLADTDQDGMPDVWELAHGLDPYRNDAAEDPDGDGLTNLVEYFNGTDPHINNATLPDADQNGMPDVWELAHGLDPYRNDAAEDPDGDGLTNLQEYLSGTGPHVIDTDGDGMPDGWEVSHGLSPITNDAAEDPDGDGYANLTEYSAGTDPRNPASYPIVTLDIAYITVTDVTPDGFAVIWQTTEPSTGSLAVYDESGALLGGLDIVSESALHSPAEDIGVMKVRVSGLDANTTYRFQTVTTAKATGLILFSPSYPQVLEVTTEDATTAVTNDRVKQELYDRNGVAAGGALLVASATGAEYPVTAWVGEGVTSPWARVDLNQLYSETTHQSLPLMGGEELTLWSFGGRLGNYLNFQRVPVPAGVDQVALPEVAALSTELGHHLDLKIDLNLVGMPVCPPTPFTSHSLLLYLKEQAGGDATAIENIKRYNRQSGTWETVSWFMGAPAGVNFPISAGEAYLIYMKRDLDGVWFEGIAQGAAVDLSRGLNLISLPVAPDTFTYTSYEMLEDLGDASEVSSVRRYDFNQGWQTSSWFLGSPSGALYNTSKGEGYLIYMKQERKEWRAY